MEDGRSQTMETGDDSGALPRSARAKKSKEEKVGAPVPGGPQVSETLENQSYVVPPSGAALKEGKGADVHRPGKQAGTYNGLQYGPV